MEAQDLEVKELEERKRKCAIVTSAKEGEAALDEEIKSLKKIYNMQESLTFFFLRKNYPAQ